MTWGQRWLNDWRYGFPRTTALDAFVGHTKASGRPTHLHTLNLHGQVVVLAFPRDDPRRIALLPAPRLPGHDAPYVVPQLALRDLNGDGHVDLLLTLRGETVVYLNRDGAFQLALPAELAQLR